MDPRLRGDDTLAVRQSWILFWNHPHARRHCKKSGKSFVVIPAKAGIHVWTRPDVKDVLKAKRSNAVMYPASAKLPCPDGIRAPGPHHSFGLPGLGFPQVFQELVRPVLPSVHHRILVGEFTFIKIPARNLKQAAAENGPLQSSSEAADCVFHQQACRYSSFFARIAQQIRTVLFA